MLGQLALAQGQLFTILPNLSGQQQGKLFAKGVGDLRIGVVVEDHLTACLALGHSELLEPRPNSAGRRADLRGMMHRRRPDFSLAALRQRHGKGLSRDSIRWVFSGVMDATT